MKRSSSFENQNRRSFTYVVRCACPYSALLPSPLDSIRDAVLTVSPKRQYLGIFSPTTPATTGPGKNPHSSHLFVWRTRQFLELETLFGSEQISTIFNMATNDVEYSCTRFVGNTEVGASSSKQNEHLERARTCQMRQLTRVQTNPELELPLRQVWNGEAVQS